MPLINADAVNGNPTLFSNTKGAVLCEENDILMLWDGERSGLVTIGHKGVVGSTFSKLQTIETIDSKFLFYFLNDKFSWIQNNRTGTGVPHVPKDLGKILFVRFPEKKSEQQKIAKVLSTTESVIEKKWVYEGNESYRPFEYGNGTMFDNKTFHCFQIRFPEVQEIFIKKVKSLIQ